MILVKSVVAMWHSAELWCLPASIMRRWYLAARVGSMRRAWPAAMNKSSVVVLLPQRIVPTRRPGEVLAVQQSVRTRTRPETPAIEQRGPLGGPLPSIAASGRGTNRCPTARVRAVMATAAAAAS